MSSPMTSTARRIMVTCATSSLGQMVMNGLLHQNFPSASLFGAVRNITKPSLDKWIKKGLVIRRGDYTDYKSLVAAFDDIHTLMFISTGSTECHNIEQHANVIRAAEVCKVRHVIYTSFLKCTKSCLPVFPNAEDCATETLLKEKSAVLPFTIFRNAFYADLIPSLVKEALETGTWVYPAIPETKVNYVATPDVSEALVKVLLNPEPHIGQTYEITSGRSYNFKEVKKIVVDASGQDKLIYQPINLMEYQFILQNRGLSEEEIFYFMRQARAMTTRNADVVDPTLKKMLGREPKRLEEYLPELFSKIKKTWGKEEIVVS